jgi:predicted SAM-dependent methyltransferase
MIDAILKRVTIPEQFPVLRQKVARYLQAREEGRWTPEEVQARLEGLCEGMPPQEMPPAGELAADATPASEPVAPATPIARPRPDAVAAAAAAKPDTDGLADPPNEDFVDRFDTFTPPYRLHLGCGHVHLQGFCNVDALPTPAADVLDDIRTLKRFPDGSVEEIYTCHVLEHFGHDEVEPLLQRWRQLLKPGGKLRISVPDLDRIVQVYAKNWPHFQKPGHTPWIGLIYGGQTTPYDFHKTGFNACWLRYVLEHNGFKDCEEYAHQPHFVPGTVDASLVFEPFGEFLSLNMIATRAEDPVAPQQQPAQAPQAAAADGELAEEGQARPPELVD